jgi:hypothetical protein
MDFASESPQSGHTVVGNIQSGFSMEYNMRAAYRLKLSAKLRERMRSNVQAM